MCPEHLGMDRTQGPLLLVGLISFLYCLIPAGEARRLPFFLSVALEEDPCLVPFLLIPESYIPEAGTEYHSHWLCPSPWYLSQDQQAVVLAKDGGPRAFIHSTSFSFPLSLQKPLGQFTLASPQPN